MAQRYFLFYCTSTPSSLRSLRRLRGAGPLARSRPPGQPARTQEEPDQGVRRGRGRPPHVWLRLCCLVAAWQPASCNLQSCPTVDMRAFRVGVAGPVGSGKTALVDCLSKSLWPGVNLAVVTNDIYTKEDAEFLIRQGTLPADRVRGVETGGCPHSAIREDASMNLDAIADLERSYPGVELIFVESGGDNLAASFSPELVDVSTLCDRRCRGRQNSAQRRPGHHALGPVGHQQDRPGAVCRSVARGDGARFAAHAPGEAVRVHQPEEWRRGLPHVLQWLAAEREAPRRAIIDAHAPHQRQAHTHEHSHG